MPIFAVIAEPARPVTMSAERTGPSSLINERETSGPNNASEPTFRNVGYPCNASTIPVKVAVRQITGIDFHPINQICSMMRRNLIGVVTLHPTALTKKTVALPVSPKRATSHVPKPVKQSVILKGEAASI
jgi:hypothetical protein